MTPGVTVTSPEDALATSLGVNNTYISASISTGRRHGVTAGALTDTTHSEGGSHREGGREGGEEYTDSLF